MKYETIKMLERSFLQIVLRSANADHAKITGYETASLLETSSEAIGRPKPTIKYFVWVFISAIYLYVVTLTQTMSFFLLIINSIQF